MDIISNEMRLKRVDFKHGALFKSQNGSNVTVTVYKSTNSIHVQGTAYFGWAKSFVEQVKAKAENILSYDEGDVTCQVPQMTSTPIRREVTLPTDDNQCHHDDDCGDDFETMDSSMFALAEEIDLLRKRIKDLESKQGIHVSKCDSATQTDPLHIGDVGADIDPQDNEKSGHAKPQSQIKTGTSNAPTYAEICAKGGNQGSQTNEKPFKSDPNKSQRGATHSGNQQSHDSRTLIIGSSILQRIDSRSLRKNVTVMKMSGAKTSDVRAKIDSMDLAGTENVILQVGGNDASNNRDIEAVENDLAGTVNAIKKKSPNARVFISDVTPRVGADVRYVNEIIRSVCRTYGATRIPTTENIRFVNYHQYWKDNIHLSDAGTTTLLKGYDAFVPILLKGYDAFVPKPRVQTESCYFCGENGHNTKTCRHGQKIRCYGCGSWGHKAKHCMKR